MLPVVIIKIISVYLQIFQLNSQWISLQIIMGSEDLQVELGTVIFVKTFLLYTYVKWCLSFHNLLYVSEGQHINITSYPPIHSQHKIYTEHCRRTYPYCFTEELLPLIEIPHERNCECPGPPSS